jgi:hypothetical protein
MDFIKDWFFTQSIFIVYGIIFLVSAGGLGLIWAGLEKIETSNLGTFFIIILCILAIFLVLALLGVLISSFLRDNTKLFELCQPVYEGPWISIVIFKAIPKKGRYVAIPFILFTLLINISVVYYGFFGNQNSNFTRPSTVALQDTRYKISSRY